MFYVHFGPQHPAAHGVLSIVTSLISEVVSSVDVIIGYLHRGSERLLIDKCMNQGVGYYDRFNYVSVVTGELCYVTAIECV